MNARTMPHSASSLNTHSFISFYSMQLLVCAMGPPGGGRNDITGRFTRHFNVIAIDSFDDDTMSKIFTSISDWHFSQGYDGSFLRLGKVGVTNFDSFVDQCRNSTEGVLLKLTKG